MSDTILPIFDEFPEEGRIIGRLVAGYGELEFGLLTLLTLELGNDPSQSAKVMYRIRGEEQRIQIADALLRKRFKSFTFAGIYTDAICAMDHCRRIRNQYAHSHWMDENCYLLFIDIENGAKTNNDMVWVRKRLINLDLLKEQEAYFVYASNLLSIAKKNFEYALGGEGALIKPPTKPARKPPLFINLSDQLDGETVN